MRCIEEQGVAHYQWRWVGSILGLEQRHVHLLQSAHLPPVEVKQLRTLAACKHQIQIVATLHQFGKVGSQRLPLLPTACCGHLESAQQLSLQTVNAHLNLSAAQSTGHTCSECTRKLVAEADILQFDVIAVVDIAHIHTHLVVLLGLHALRESHRLGLHLTVGVKLGHGLHALVGRHDGWETAVGIILKLLYSHTATETATLWQLACVVEEVAVSFIVGHATVVSKRVGIAQRHNLAGILPWAQWRWSCAVRDMLRHAACCIQQLINTVALGEPWALYVRVLIFLSLLALLHHRTAEGLLGHGQPTQFTLVRNHVSVQLQIIYLWISPHQPSLSVVINHNCWVDMVP